MAIPSNTPPMPSKLFVKNKEAGGWRELSSPDGFNLEKMEVEDSEPITPSFGESVDFTFTINPDKKTKRAFKRIMREAKKPLTILYKELPLFPRIKFWLIVHWAKILHKPFAIEIGGKLITAKDINEIL